MIDQARHKQVETDAWTQPARVSESVLDFLLFCEKFARPAFPLFPVLRKAEKVVPFLGDSVLETPHIALILGDEGPVVGFEICQIIVLGRASLFLQNVKVGSRLLN